MGNFLSLYKEQEQAFALWLSDACTSGRVSENKRERESFVVSCIVFIYMKIFVCFIKQACLLAAHVHELCGICHSAHSIINSLSHFSFLENICLSYKTSSLACNPNFQISKFGGG
jgi:hypothetical protein